MIYVGLFHFNDDLNTTHELSSVLESYTANPPSLIRKKQFTLCYGKLSNMNDMDEAWENESSILLGRIFNKVERPSFNKKSFESLFHFSQEEALNGKWGKYIYITHNEKNSEFEVMLDSTGQLPFFLLHPSQWKCLICI